MRKGGGVMSTPNPNYKPDENTEPAFPVFDSEHYPHYRGMTLRDWFAGQALAGICVGVDDPNEPWIAQKAYQIADAMMEARKK